MMLVFSVEMVCLVQQNIRISPKTMIFRWVVMVTWDCHDLKCQVGVEIETSRGFQEECPHHKAKVAGQGWLNV